MHFKNILFDLDGTLTDSGPGITKSVQYALKKFGIVEPDLKKLGVFVGPPLEESFMKYYGFSHESYPAVLAAFHEYFLVNGIFDNSVYPGILQLLQELNGQGKNCFVATTKPYMPACRVLEHFHLKEYFRDIGAPQDENPLNGDKGKIIGELLRKNGICDLTETVMIGDRARDADGARQNGILFCGVLYGYGSEEEMKAAEIEYTAATVKDLYSFLTEE